MPNYIIRQSYKWSHDKEWTQDPNPIVMAAEDPFAAVYRHERVCGQVFGKECEHRIELMQEEDCYGRSKDTPACFYAVPKNRKQLEAAIAAIPIPGYTFDSGGRGEGMGWCPNDDEAEQKYYAHPWWETEERFVIQRTGPDGDSNNIDGDFNWTCDIATDAREWVLMVAAQIPNVEAEYQESLAPKSEPLCDTMPVITGCDVWQSRVILAQWQQWADEELERLQADGDDAEAEDLQILMRIIASQMP